MIQQAIRTIRTFLPSAGSVTLEQIEEAVGFALSIPIYSEIDRNILIHEVQSIYNIRIDDFRVIEAPDRRRHWITEKKSVIQWNFWKRYRDYMQIEKNFSNVVINQLDRLTDRTLDGLFNPAINAAISKYGLVVGQVQSGKTSNYTGLICKGVDAGFKLIIVLAGIHNNLRSQTQLRLDEGFLGFNTKHAQVFNQIADSDLWIGVGKISRKEIAHSITSCKENGDFNRGAFNALGLNFHTNEPIIAVVKKNSKVLDRLLQWLTAQAIDVDGRQVIRDKSLLLIDDEADNASINTNPDSDHATKINSLIRNILRLFDKSGYVGYTATPFANIFIPIVEDDLFPRDFIINLPAPSNYIGPDKVFGFNLVEEDEFSDTVLPIVRRIEDSQRTIPSGHKSTDPLPTEIPASLMMAIKCFILTCAIRRLRGQTSVHNSMLVHATRYVLWQKHLKTLVENVFDFYKRGIEMNIPSVLEEIRQAFEMDADNYKSFKTTSGIILDSTLKEIDPRIQVHEWHEVLQHLNDAASRILVKEINGGSVDALNYFDHKEGLSVIAIGGDKLSRGLTLEGLSVSYYLRASRMYDTLMQMGRWFGYRPGYVDLCRLFTTRELNEWFCHITLASEELRNEFDYMSDVSGSTPDQYALRVRNHPGVLQISASNKIRTAVMVDVSWAGRLVESYEFTKNPDVLKANLSTTVDFIKSLTGIPKIIQDNYVWFNIPAQNIRKFLQGFKLSESLKAADPSNLLRFIDVQLSNDELTSWRVAIMSKTNTEQRLPIITNEQNYSIGCYLRVGDDKSSDKDVYYLKKSHLISPRDEFIDLTEAEYQWAMDRTRLLWQNKNKIGDPKYPNGEIVRNEIRDPKNPLLIIYLLDPNGADVPLGTKPQGNTPIASYAISFPSSRFTASVSYAVPEQLLPIFNLEDNIEEADDDED